MKNEKSVIQLCDASEFSVMPAGQNDHAFDALYKQFWPVLTNFAAQYLGDRQTCEEIVQDLFVQLYMRGIKVKIKSKLKTYLLVALKNRIFNYFRNRAVYNKHISLAAKMRLVTQNNVEQSIYLKELQNSVSTSLGNMPSRCSEVFLLKQEQLTIKQISKTLNRPKDTVEKQLRKAKKMIIERISAQ